MTDRELLQLARTHLNGQEFDVWFANTYRALGRHNGSIDLRITETQWRTRLTTARRKLAQALDERAA
jgi:hypothetical protein